MRFTTMQNAIVCLLLAKGLSAAGGAAAAEESIAVVHIRSIDGLNVPGAGVQVKSDGRFVAGSKVRVSRTAVASLGGVKTLVLVDRRTDAKSGDKVVQNHESEVLAVNGDTFVVKGVDGQSITYVVDVLSDGSVDLIGPSDRIVVRSGGSFKIWKIEDASLVSADRISLF